VVVVPEAVSAWRSGRVGLAGVRDVGEKNHRNRTGGTPVWAFTTCRKTTEAIGNAVAKWIEGVPEKT
jgi:hypothetical protein